MKDYTVTGTAGSNGAVEIKKDGSIEFIYPPQDVRVYINDKLVTRNRRKGTIRKTMRYGFCLFWVAFLMYMIILAYESYVF